MKTEFYSQHKRELEQIRDECRAQLLDDVIPFWEKRVVDRECGGYYNCFDREGQLYDTTKQGWFVGRNLYTFSALYNHMAVSYTHLLIMSDNMMDEVYGYQEGPERDAFMEMLNHMQPLAPGKMEDISDAALYLASDMSSYVTGQIIMVDGGASIKAH